VVRRKGEIVIYFCSRVRCLLRYLEQEMVEQLFRFSIKLSSATRLTIQMKRHSMKCLVQGHK